MVQNDAGCLPAAAADVGDCAPRPGGGFSGVEEFVYAGTGAIRFAAPLTWNESYEGNDQCHLDGALHAQL